MADKRIPVQRRSIERKQKILSSGFKLFCEHGYYKTNTIEIAKHAGVSTGAVYSYFKDKREIYIAAFDSYLEEISGRLFEELEQSQTLPLPDFVENWVTVYLELYAASGHALVQLRIMILEDEEINRHFSDLENEYFMKLIRLLNKNGVERVDLMERIYTCCILIDALRQEQSSFSHIGLNFFIFKEGYQFNPSIIVRLNCLVVRRKYRENAGNTILEYKKRAINK